MVQSCIITNQDDTNNKENVNNVYLDQIDSDEIEDTINLAILDSGCTKTVCGMKWYMIFVDSYTLYNG